MKTHKDLAKNSDLARGCIASAMQIALSGVALTHTALLGAMLTTAAHAEEASAPSPSQLPAIRVEETEESTTAAHSTTGAKTDTPIIETPQSVSVVTSDFIQTIGATRLKDALAYTAGVNTSPWGDESQYDWLYIRGADAYSPGFYKDGLQLRNVGTWSVWQTENYGTERLEILRGPASVLYGQNGPGGVINVVSKQPTADRGADLEVQIGNQSRRQVAADLRGPATDSLLYRFTGLVRDGELAVGDLPDDRVFLAPALTWQPTQDTSLTVLAEYLRMRVGSVWKSYPAVGTLLPNPNGHIPVDTFIGERDFDRYDQDQWQIGYLLDHRIDTTWTLRQGVRYGRYETDYRTSYNGQFVTVNPDDPNDPSNFRLMARSPFASDEEARSFVVDNQVQASFGSDTWQHTALLGLDYQRTRFDVNAIFSGVAAPIDLYAPERGGEVVLNAPGLDSLATYQQTGVYVQDQLKFQKHWVATLGGRYDRAKIATNDRLADANSQQTDSAFTGRAGLVYLAPSGWAPYVSYSESFMPTTTLDTDTGKPFKPETGRQYEAGLRYQPEETNGSYSVAAFDVRRRDFVTYDETFTPGQTGEVEVRGVEFEAAVQPIVNLNVTAAYTWTPKADVLASNNSNEIGKQLLVVQEHQASVWADYRFEIGVKVGTGVRYTGSSYGSKEMAPTKIPDYTLLDAMIGYDVGPWLFALNARNLTDKRYVATCDGSGQSCSYGQSRRVTATASYRW